MKDADELLCAALRCERPPWPSNSSLTPADLLHRARAQGVLPLLRLRGGTGWPQPVTDEIQAVARGQAVWELRHQLQLQKVLTALFSAGLAPVVMKGSALAYTHYSQPWQRPRGDTDILLPHDAISPATAILTGQGFHPVLAAPSNQTTFVSGGEDGIVHVLDLHWRFNNSPLLAALFPYAELRDHAVPLPALGSAALAPDDVYALAIACVHAETHTHNPYYVEGRAYLGADRLIWLFDMDLLASRFTTEEWRRFAALALSKGLAGTSARALSCAHRDLGTRIPEDVMSTLSAAKHEEPLRYLSAPPWRQHWMDLRSLPDWTARRRWIRNSVLPSPAYMRSRFGNTQPLALLYMRRAAGGVLRRLHRAGKS